MILQEVSRPCVVRGASVVQGKYIAPFKHLTGGRDDAHVYMRRNVICRPAVAYLQQCDKLTLSSMQ